MNSIEELIQKWEQEIAKVNPFKEDNAKWYDSEWTNGRHGVISQFLEDLKNLPNELRAVNRNENAEEFCRFGYSKHDRCNNECNSTGCELK
jgi:3-oxoacyl-ACP reductase-like protein